MIRRERSSLDTSDFFLKYKQEKKLEDVKTEQECFKLFDKDK
jgi:hypothetical protein